MKSVNNILIRSSFDFYFNAAKMHYVDIRVINNDSLLRDAPRFAVGQSDQA
jgi:hypothetical protein